MRIKNNNNNYYKMMMRRLSCVCVLVALLGLLGLEGAAATRGSPVVQATRVVLQDSKGTPIETIKPVMLGEDATTITTESSQSVKVW